MIRFFEDGDRVEVTKIVTNAFDSLNEDLWLWKYLGNPNFDESLVFIAENNGKVIGCMHYLPRELKITRTLKVKGALGADLAVHRDYRQRGIGSSMLKFSRSSKALEKKGIILTYGFVGYRRAKFYGRNIDSIIIPLSTTKYKKFFNTSPIEERLSKIEILNRSVKADMDVLFRLRGFPSFTLRIENGKISVDKGETLNPDVTVEGDPYFLESLYDGDKGILNIIRGILKGKIKIRGSLRKILSFYKIIKTIRGLSQQED